MDELSAFRGAPIEMRNYESNLFQHADLVFTGGASLFKSKRTQHHSVHCFPSSIDFPHFASARTVNDDPEDQSNIPQPRIGYAGVIDERLDIDLLREVAEAAPDWHFVLLGPVVKIDPATLPSAPNIHYLGMKSYSDLPRYFSGWRIGMLPFALNEATRFISPTKTPEYLAAGLRVISTPISDVVNPYGHLGLVSIAATPREFISIANSVLESPCTREHRKVDEYLAQSSWDRTWSQMNNLISDAITHKLANPVTPLKTTSNLSREGSAHV
jgi:UDP-galactopyranose mutase